MNRPAKHIYEFGPFQLNVSEHLLRRAGTPVALTPKAVDALIVLVQHRGHTLDKQELMGVLWPDSIVIEANLTVTISMLRKALGEGGGEAQYIETIPKRGYRFIADVREIKEERPAWRYTAAPFGARSMAVLPFTSFGPEDRDQFMELGMADALITNLSNVRQIAVRPTSVVLKYADLVPDPLAAGSELSVDYVLDGKIQRASDRIRVTVQLVSVRDGAPLWAGKFDERMTDIFGVQDSISEQVTQALTLKLTSEEHRRLTKRHTENADAYQAYLKGRYFWNKWSTDGLNKAIEYFQQAVEKDPAYALAYAGLADGYVALGFWGVSPSEGVMLKAEAAAARALEIDDSLADAHASLAFARLFYHWDWPGAQAEIQRAVALNPGCPSAHLWNSFYLMAMNHPDEAIDEVRQAQALDPLSPPINASVGWELYLARRYDEAIEQCRAALELDPTFAWVHRALGWSYQEKAMFDEALAAFREASALSGSGLIDVAEWATACAVAGRTREAQKVLDNLKKQAAQAHVPAMYPALIYAALGDDDRAFEWLGTACDERSGRLVFLNVEPFWDRLRSDPRFTDLLHRVGLAEPVR